MLSTVIDVAIGLVFIYLLYSLLATSIQEAISTILHRRANTLYDGVKSMLTNTKVSKGFLIDTVMWLGGLVLKLSEKFMRLFKKEDTGPLYKQFYTHPIIKNYGQSLLFRKPSYLSADNFANIIVDTIKNLDDTQKSSTVTFALLQNTITTRANEFDKETLQILQYHLNEAAGDLDVFKTRLAKWYNDTMDRVSGWYKRNTQFWLFGLGITLAVMLNIDSIEITNYLSQNKTAREQMAQMGVAAARQDTALSHEVMDSIKSQLDKVTTVVGLGWGDYGRSDTAFMRLCLKKEKTKKQYDKNRQPAIAYFDSLCNQAKYNLDTARAANNKNLKDFEKLVNSLENNEAALISHQQFVMLYDSDKFSNKLKLRYVLCYKLRSPHKIIGFLITAFAIGLGAPFWFDLLNKFVSLRAAVKSVNSSGSTTRNNQSGDNDEIDG